MRGWGGRRKGAGAPRKLGSDIGITLGFRLPMHQVEVLEVIAARMGITRSALLRSIVSKSITRMRRSAQ